MPADNAAAEATGDQNVARNSADEATQNSELAASVTKEPISKGILDRLGLPEELRSEIGLGETQRKASSPKVKRRKVSPEASSPEASSPEASSPKVSPEASSPKAKRM